MKEKLLMQKISVRCIIPKPVRLSRTANFCFHKNFVDNRLETVFVKLDVSRR